MFAQVAWRCGVPMSEKQVAGWGVVRVYPWRLAGIFETQAEALERMEQLSPAYVVRFGDGFPRSGDFFWDAIDSRPT